MARRLKNWLKAYLQYTEASESPERFHFWTGVSTIAGALRRKVWLDMGLFEWSPNFFIFFVAPPGIVSKSTTAGIGMALLKETEGIRFGPSALTWQALIDALEEANETVALEGEDILTASFSMSSLTVHASELGTLFDPEDRKMIDVLVDLWDCQQGPWKKRLVTRGEQVVFSPWLNIIAGTTPAWIGQNLSTHFVEGGLSSRCVYIYGEFKRRLVAYPFVLMSDKHDRLRGDLLEDLKSIASLRGAYSLSSDGLEWGTEWYERHYSEQESRGFSDKFIGHIARKQTHMHKLAIVLAASEGDERVVTARHLSAAERSVARCEEDLTKVFGMMNREQITEYASDALATVQKEGRITKEELFRTHFVRRVSYETFTHTLDALTASGLVLLEIDGGKAWLRANELLLARKAKKLSES